MSWFENFSLLMRSNLTSLQEKLENPERMLHQLILDMEEEHARLHTNVAGALADEIQLARQVEQAREEARQWLERATQAVQRGDEETSLAALDQKILAEQRAETLTSEHSRQREQVARLRRSVADLEHKIRQADHKRTLLVARLHHARSSQQINQALDSIDRSSAFAQFRRLENQVDRAEALCLAHDRLAQRDPDADELRKRCAEEERRGQLLKEYEELKRRVAGE